MSDQDSEDDKVGYKRPPKKNQFKPGESGNLSGRPKKRKSSNEIFYEQMHREHGYTENGTQILVPRIEVLYHKMFQEALRGNLAFMDRYLEAVKAAEREMEERRNDPMESLINPLPPWVDAPDIKNALDSQNISNCGTETSWFEEILEKEATLQGTTPEKLFKKIISKLKKDAAKPEKSKKKSSRH